jgi:phospholipid/cholesterol/gamma-HCH transport system permease protein
MVAFVEFLSWLSGRPWVQALGHPLLLTGQVLVRLLQGKLSQRSLGEQLLRAGPHSLPWVLAVNGLGGVVFALQTAREMWRWGTIEVLGGIFTLALCRELAPLMTGAIVVGLLGSTYAGELATMRATHQIDALQLLRTNPVDYLVLPRVVACGIMVPILTVFGITLGIGGGMLVAAGLYHQDPGTFLGSVRLFVQLGDLWGGVLKGAVFGLVVALLGCSWGLAARGDLGDIAPATRWGVVSGGLGVLLADLVLSWGVR